VASSKLQQQAAQQDYQATRYDVLLAVNQAYFNTLQAQAVVKVAQETVATRKQLFDQISALAENKLKSQLDVNFADVNLSDAKLLLLRAEDNLQQAYAELARAIGTDQSAMFELTKSRFQRARRRGLTDGRRSLQEPARTGQPASSR